MSIIQIPCTRFSKKIIAKEHGAEPIRVNRLHALWVFLRPHVAGHGIGRSHFVSDRSTSFLIEVSPELARLLRRSHNDAGVALHRHHLEMMLRFTWASSLNGSQAMTALRAWQELYDLDDEDYDLGTAYRMWQRFRVEMEKSGRKTCNFSGMDVLSFCKPSDELPLPDGELDELVKNAHRSMDASPQYFPRYIFEQVAIWLHVRQGRRRVDDTSELFEKSLRSTYYALERIDGYIDTDPFFADLLSEPEPAVAGGEVPAAPAQGRLFLD